MPRPSVFISYASEDRAAARVIRDALSAAGLDVWYDENELGGGDAWDQKIRKQIRDCDYFMPLVSATTERRKEGYFRREWRLAAERTLDMADDVLFLLPIAIDDTDQAAARVPEKFLTVQWLRLPGGRPTPAFDALAQRLLAGEHTALPRTPLPARVGALPPVIPGAASRPPLPPAPAAAPHAADSEHARHAPPPMPPFPHAPAGGGIGGGMKYIAEILWWGVTAAWLLIMRLPRWLRIVLAIWLVLTLLGPCRVSTPSKLRTKDKPAAPGAPATPDADLAAVNAITKDVIAGIEAAKSGNAGGQAASLSRLGQELARRFGGLAHDPQLAGKQLVLVPFVREAPAAGGEAPEGGAFAEKVFNLTRDRLLAQRGMDRLGTTPPAAAPASDELLVTLGNVLGANFVLGARLAERAAATEPGAHLAPDAGARELAVRLLRIKDGALLWSGAFAVGSDPEKAAAQIAAAVQEQVPERAAK